MGGWAAAGLVGEQLPGRSVGQRGKQPPPGTAAPIAAPQAGAGTAGTAAAANSPHRRVRRPPFSLSVAKGGDALLMTA